MIHQWGGAFRSAFDRLGGLKDLFPKVPIIALTATLRQSFEEQVIADVLRDPVITKGTVNRPYLDINIKHYPGPLRAKNGGEDWEEVATMVDTMIGNETAIIYSPFAHSCDPLCAIFLSKGPTPAAYTGKNKKPEEKKVIHENMIGKEFKY